MLCRSLFRALPSMLSPRSDNMMPSVSLGLLVSLACFHTGSRALKCFECNSHNDPKCALEKPPKELAKDCPENIGGPKYTMCRKITQTIEFEVNGLPPDTRVIRSCGWDESNYKGRCYQRSGFGGRQEVCSCITDLCNGSSPLQALAIVLIALLAATRLL